MVRYGGELSLVERNCFVISRSTVQFCPLAPCNTMGYEISLIAHFFWGYAGVRIVVNFSELMKGQAGPSCVATKM